MRRKTALALVLLAAVSAFVAWKHWIAGTPPTWSYFARHDRTEVLAATLVDAPSGSAHSHHAQIDIAWPPGSGQARRLPGVEPTHVPSQVWTAEQILREHPVGQRISVRVIGGEPFADRTDVSEMIYSVFFSFSCIACLAGAIVLARRSPPSEEDTPT